MNKLVEVRMLVNTNKDQIGDIRELNPERAAAWVEHGRAEYVKQPATRKKSKKLTEEGE